MARTISHSYLLNLEVRHFPKFDEIATKRKSGVVGKPKEGKALSQSPSDPQSANPPSASGASSQQPRSANELLAAYARGDRMFAHWNLAGADLNNATLKDANFFH